MSNFSDPSPAFTAPSTADEIYGVLDKALEVQTAFNDAHHLVKSLEGDLGPHAAAFTMDMKKLSDQYRALFTKSQTQSNDLHSKISYFITGVIPAIQSPKYTDEQKKKTVSNTAKAISNLAEKSRAECDVDIAALVKALGAFFIKLSQEQTKVVSRNRAILDKLQDDIKSIAAKVEENGSLFSRLSAMAQKTIGSLIPSKAAESKVDKPVTAAAANGRSTVPPSYTVMLGKMKEVGDFFNNEEEYSKAEADLDSHVETLQAIKKQAKSEALALERALGSVEMIRGSLPGLVDKMAAFTTVWTKLSVDANRLKAYLDTDTPDMEQMFTVDAVLAQKDVYVALLKALDTYCLKVAV